MLRAIDRSAPSTDRAALTVDSLFAHRSIDGTARSIDCCQQIELCGGGFFVYLALRYRVILISQVLKKNVPWSMPVILNPVAKNIGVALLKFWLSAETTITL